MNHDNPTYAAMIESLDDSVGVVLDKLDELGLADNTVVVFTSDNGGVAGSVTSNVPLRSGKGTTYEGGDRVPLLIRKPGEATPGSTSDVAVTSEDFYPTLLEMAGIAPDPLLPLDGESFFPLIQQSGPLSRDAIFRHFPHYDNAGRGPAGSVRQGDYKLIEFFETGDVELYDLAADIGEQNDLTSAMPNKVAELRALLAGWREDVGAQMPTLNPNYGIATGPTFVWDGGLPGGVQGRWDSNIHESAKGKWNLQPDPVTNPADAPILQPVANHLAAFPSDTYSFPGGAAHMTATDFATADASGADDSASFEVWFRLASMISGPQVLFETGDGDSGLSLTVGNGGLGGDGNDDDIRLRVGGTNSASSASLTANLSEYARPDSDFVQVVGVVNDVGTQRYVRLFINGAQFATVDLGTSDLDWDSAASSERRRSWCRAAGR